MKKGKEERGREKEGKGGMIEEGITSMRGEGE